MSQKITPVILSGGAGTRLWPLSRKQKPKQFIALHQAQTPFEQTYARCTDTNLFSNPLILCSKSHRFLVHELLGDRAYSIIMEPCPRNTAPAIAIAALAATEDNPQALLLVMPSDHFIPDTSAFLSAVKRAAGRVEEGGVALFGIAPQSPHTGYGYIERGEECGQDLYKIKSFREKPDVATASSYITSGLYLWNSGIFLLHAQTYLQELKRLEPETYQACKESWGKKTSDLGDILLDEASFQNAKSVSIDYSIMEKTTGAYVLQSHFGWSDLGSWDALYDANTAGAQNSVLVGDVINNGTNNYVRSEGPLLCVHGVDNIVAIAMSDVVLIAPRGAAESVGALVQDLDKRKRSEVTESRLVFRPWGSYEIIGEGAGYKTKRIIVQPGKKLSLQSHKQRAEHWVVVSGLASVTLDEKTLELSANQSVYVPCGTVHRLENKQAEPLILIEVQTGAYLGEDDIQRFDDDYGRN